MKTLPLIFVLLSLTAAGAQAQAAAQTAPATQAPAQEAPAFTPDDIANIQWMNYYYFHKDASKVPQFLQFVDRTITKHANAAEPTAAFLSVIFDAHQDKVAGWMKDAKFSPKAKEVVASALWLSGNKPALIGAESPKGTAPKLAAKDVKTVTDLDVMWAAFFATGNDLYIKKIIGVLDEKKSLTGNQETDATTRNAAAWSLSSNAMQHELVNRTLARETNARTGQVKSTLEKIAEDIRTKVTPFPNKDGSFSATLIPTSVENVKAFETPGAENMQITEKTQVKPGDPVALIIVFSGMELDKDLNADVTYDMNVLGPDGKPYDNFAEKNLEALKTRLPSRFRVFHNGYYPVVKFADKDTPGKYTVKVSVRDNVSKKVLTWSKEIELTTAAAAATPPATKAPAR